MKCKPEFFGMKKLPKISIDENALLALANESVNKGLTVAGVQRKLSLHLSEESDSRLTLVGYPAGYILKPQSSEYLMLPEAEDLCMDMAELCGIKTVPHGLIETENGELAYITKRIDRVENSKLAMEDFCQLSERATEDKYKSSYEQCVKIINTYSDFVGLDLSEFFLRIVFCFVTGNSDMHLKNFSLIEDPCTGLYRLSEAYDLLPVQLVATEDIEDTALTMLGKKKNFKKQSFLEFAEIAQIDSKVAVNMMNKVIACENAFYDLIENSYLSKELKINFKNLVKDRIEVLK